MEFLDEFYELLKEISTGASDQSLFEVDRESLLCSHSLQHRIRQIREKIRRRLKTMRIDLDLARNHSRLDDLRPNPIARQQCHVIRVLARYSHARTCQAR